MLFFFYLCSLHKSLIKVRGLHCCAARKSVSLGGGTISQMDMVLTQFGFMGICLSKRDYLGMKGDDKDVEGFIHFWKTVGYLMGIEDRYVNDDIIPNTFFFLEFTIFLKH